MPEPRAGYLVYRADQTRCLQWADFAVQHKGTSYKLHVYVAWAKELNSDINHGSATDLMDGAGLSAGALACLMGPEGQPCVSGGAGSRSK